MGSRGGKENNTLADLGCSEETITKLTIATYEKEEALSRRYLLKAFDLLNTTLGRSEEKDYHRVRKATERDSLSDLVIKVVGLAELVGGALVAEREGGKQTADLLNSVLKDKARDAFQAAIDTKFRIRLQEIIIGSLDRQLREKQ